MNSFETKIEQPNNPQETKIESENNLSLEELAEKSEELEKTLIGYQCDQANNIEKQLKQEKEKLISEAIDFKELFKVLNRIEDLDKISRGLGRVSGSKKYYEIIDIKRIINKVRGGKLDIDYVTQTLGLKNKVSELLEKEKQSTCSKCGFIGENGANFCKKCGTKL